MPALFLKPGREKSVLRRHPWVFSGAVARVEGNPEPGANVDLINAGGQLLGCGAYSPVSQIRARMWSFDPTEQVDAQFLKKRIQAAMAARVALGLSQSTDSSRLIYAESDGLPGLIVDRYGDTLVLQSLTTGSDYWKETIADLLLDCTGLTNIYERSDADVRELEGLSPKVGWLRGSLPEPVLIIQENTLKFHLNLETGHKTGFYLDQRENRLRLRALAKDREVLDCFSYTGGFSVNALAGEARSVLSVDASAEALVLCQENVVLNQSFEARHSMLQGDVFQLLRRFRDEARSFDLIVLDPPKFAPTMAQAEKAARGYKDINLLAFKLLRPGGLLFTFSCSGGVDATLFQKIVASAALDAGVEAQILEILSQAPDHPVALNFPEAAYLKGLICRRA